MWGLDVHMINIALKDFVFISPELVFKRFYLPRYPDVRSIVMCHMFY